MSAGQSGSRFGADQVGRWACLLMMAALATSEAMFPNGHYRFEASQLPPPRALYADQRRTEIEERQKYAKLATEWAERWQQLLDKYQNTEDVQVLQDGLAVDYVKAGFENEEDSIKVLIVERMAGLNPKAAKAEIPLLLNILQTSTEIHAAANAAWTLAKLAPDSPDVVEAVVHQIKVGAASWSFQCSAAQALQQFHGLFGHEDELLQAIQDSDCEQSIYYMAQTLMQFNPEFTKAVTQKCAEIIASENGDYSSIEGGLFEILEQHARDAAVAIPAIEQRLDGIDEALSDQQDAEAIKASMRRTIEIIRKANGLSDARQNTLSADSR